MSEDQLLDIKAAAQRSAIGLSPHVDPDQVVKLVDEVLHLRDLLASVNDPPPWFDDGPQRL